MAIQALNEPFEVVTRFQVVALFRGHLDRLDADALPTWVNSRPLLVVSPPAEPYSTLTAPASSTLPTFSPEAPAARARADAV